MKINKVKFANNATFMLKVVGAIAAAETMGVGAVLILKGKVVKGVGIMAVGFCQIAVVAASQSIED